MERKTHKTSVSCGMLHQANAKPKTTRKQKKLFKSHFEQGEHMGVIFAV